MILAALRAMAVFSNPDRTRPAGSTQVLPKVLLLGFFCYFWNGSGASGEVLPPPSKQQIDFIRDIQPILAAHCYECHGSGRQENELRWDQKSSALKGGSSGPAIIPGKSAESRMIRLVSGLEKNLIMPKRGERLTPKQIGLLRAWIDQGAAWPDEVAEAKKPNKADWWSFKPAKKPPLPSLATLKNKKWPRNPLDLFILAKLEKEGLGPSLEADRRTLIRRLSFDLTGLPPTPEEVERFISDRDPNDYEKLVDRLLASPRYGERWARHWLDTVHYADTHGYDKDKVRSTAWPYRDYVIKAFNDDKPYSRFVEEQLAGDILFPEDPEPVVALGFIAAGPWDFVGHFELPIEKTDGLIARYNDRDDMVMTTMSTFQSLTVHCARCHDHKFDPITQKDYYGLQAVFAGVDRAERPFDHDKNVYGKRRSLIQQKTKIEDQYIALTNEVAEVINPQLKEFDAMLETLRIQRFALATEIDTEKSPGNGFRSNFEPVQDSEKWVQIDLGKSIPVDEVRLYPARPVDFSDTLGFGFPRRFRVEFSETTNFWPAEIIADHTTTDFPHRGADGVSLPAKGKVARFVRLIATRLWERGRDYVFALGEIQVMAGGTNAAFGAAVSASDSFEGGYWSKKYLVDGFDSRQRLPNYPRTEIFQAKEKLDAEVRSLAEERKLLSDALTSDNRLKELTQLQSKLEKLDQDLAALPTPELVYAATSYFAPTNEFKPARQPRPVHLLARGDVKRPGGLVMPAAISAVPGLNAQFQISDPMDEGARRAALAKWITDPSNLLTRRSIVNRVWHYHFGRGIVETPNDFGHMGAQPTHPELLDWLAYWFQENGESIKALHRLIVTSATYRQSSLVQPKSVPLSHRMGEGSGVRAADIDADNRYLWRMNRTRLDAETIRDSILSISGKLDLTMGGPAVQQFYFKDDHSPVYDYSLFDVDSPTSCRRSIYRFIVRSVPDPLMDALDFPDPSILCPKRNVTTTSLQALAMLNDPFVLKQSEHLAERLQKSGNLKKQINEIYRLALNRAPSRAESKKLQAFAKQFGLTNTCRMVFNTSEFMFVD